MGRRHPMASSGGTLWGFQPCEKPESRQNTPRSGNNPIIICNLQQIKKNDFENSRPNKNMLAPTRTLQHVLRRSVVCHAKTVMLKLMLNPSDLGCHVFWASPYVQLSEHMVSGNATYNGYVLYNIIHYG